MNRTCLVFEACFSHSRLRRFQWTKGRMWSIWPWKSPLILLLANLQNISFTVPIHHTIEKLCGRKSTGSGLENREYGRVDPSRWLRGTLYPQKWALTSPTSGGRSVGIVRSRTKATEFSLVLFTFGSPFTHSDMNGWRQWQSWRPAHPV
jgi:hypothetical protein